MLNFCGFTQVYVFTTNHHLKYCHIVIKEFSQKFIELPTLIAPCMILKVGSCCFKGIVIWLIYFFQIVDKHLLQGNK